MSLNYLSYEATVLFCFSWIFPLTLWGIIWWCGHQSRLSVLEIVCIYAYSLLIYIPVSMLWVMQIGWLQWLLVLLGAVLSGFVVLMTIWPTVEENRNQETCGIFIVILLVYLLLTVGSMLYLPHDPPLLA